MAWMTKRGRARYALDPSSNEANSSPFGREVGSDDVEDRIIAPVRDKSRDLKRAFVDETYARALDLMKGSDIVVTIGYSFNPHDRASYQPLLHALGKSKRRRLLVVSPDASTVGNAVREDLPELSVEPQEATFKQWVTAFFPGLDSVR